MPRIAIVQRPPVFLNRIEATRAAVSYVDEATADGASLND